MFDWAAYLTLAEELAKRTGDEAAQRSAVSRAYYAAFGCAAARLREEGVNIPETGYAHKFAWDTYAKDESLDRLAIGEYGHLLKRKRRHADYKDRVFRLPEEVSDSIETCRELLRLLYTVRLGRL